MKNVSGFYDHFTAYQQARGINNRHLKILSWLNLFGLKRWHRVLEIGCGIGTISELILRTLNSKGSLIGVDISLQSIELAKERLEKYNNAQFIIGDIIDIREINGHFDIIVLPDVLEHIPMNSHNELFGKLKKLLAKNGKIIVHIPEPHYLEWLHKSNSSSLQIIDQPIFLDHLQPILLANSLVISYLQSYSIYTEEHDYQIIEIIHKPAIDKVKELKSYYTPGFIIRVIRKLTFILRGFK